MLVGDIVGMEHKEIAHIVALPLRATMEQPVVVFIMPAILTKQGELGQDQVVIPVQQDTPALQLQGVALFILIHQQL